MISKEKIEQFRKMQNLGEIYDCMDSDFINYQHELVQKIYEYNHTPETKEGIKKREEILKSALGTYGENLYIIPPVSANCGLSNVHVLKNCTITGKHTEQII